MNLWIPFFIIVFGLLNGCISNYDLNTPDNAVHYFDIPDKNIRDDLLKNKSLINNFCELNGFVFGSTQYVNKTEYYFYQRGIYSDIGVICVDRNNNRKLFEGSFYKYTDGKT